MNSGVPTNLNVKPIMIKNAVQSVTPPPYYHPFQRSAWLLDEHHLDKEHPDNEHPGVKNSDRESPDNRHLDEEHLDKERPDNQRPDKEHPDNTRPLVYRAGRRLAPAPAPAAVLSSAASCGESTTPLRPAPSRRRHRPQRRGQWRHLSPSPRLTRCHSE